MPDETMTMERFRALGDEQRAEVTDWVNRHFPDGRVVKVTYRDGVATVAQRNLAAPRDEPTETQVAVEEPPPWLRDGWVDA